MTGRIVRLNKERGFGFARVSNNPRVADVFVHCAEFSGSFDALEIGTVLHFEVAETTKGLRATNIMLA
jgi:cold shock CspA family protein